MKIPRVLITAASSGSGKTVISCGLMEALKQKKLQVVSCKCGPDYIDPMFHREVLGIESENLDLFFNQKEQLRQLFLRHAKEADIAVIEGVMGYYDGMGLNTETASSYDVAATLEIPAVLVLPCRGMALSAAALVKGFLEFKPDSNIRGILLNRISAMLYPKMKEMLETELKKAGYEVKVLGYVPEQDVFRLESRHLGLVTPKEIESLQGQLKKAGEILSETVDLDGLLEIASTAPDISIPYGQEETEGNCIEKVRIGVARDAAFGFYYKDNLELLRELGCEIVEFSPLKDHELPKGIQGLILGGGYPELYAKELSQNQKMLDSIRFAVRNKMPCHAECGGFLYLQESLQDKAGKSWKMTGVIPGVAFPTGKLVRFGYIQLKSKKDGAFLKMGESIRGHEFHYWDSTNNGEDAKAYKPDGKRSWECIHVDENLFAGFPHLSYRSNPEFAIRFVQAAKRYGNRKEG